MGPELKCLPTKMLHKVTIIFSTDKIQSVSFFSITIENTEITFTFYYLQIRIHAFFISPIKI